MCAQALLGAAVKRLIALIEWWKGDAFGRGRFRDSFALVSPDLAVSLHQKDVELRRNAIRPKHPSADVYGAALLFMHGVSDKQFEKGAAHLPDCAFDLAQLVKQLGNKLGALVVESSRR